MKDPLLERVTRSLQRVEGPGSFCAYHRESGMGLSIDVEGVGRCQFPIDEARAQALVASAGPSPFGYREQTRHDRSVRDSWEIAGDRVRLDDKAWSRRFERGLAELTEALGLPADAEVTARLQKLLIYGPGQFFAPHRDTEKSATMWGTMVVLLPSTYEGGQVVISHAGQQVTHDTATDGARGSVGFLGFYADCMHETKPVERGHRVALTYALEVDAPEAIGPPSGDDHRDLRQGLAGYFGASSDRDPPWLVVLLDHHYAPQSLDWARLKNSDRTRADALRAVAGSLGCDCFLTLADVHESFECDEEDDEGSFEYEGVPPGGYGSLMGRELTLDRWIDEHGRPCEGTEDPADIDCIVSTAQAHERDAYERMYSPWTGNEGGHAEQWYYQAAVVVVPQNHPLRAEIAERKPERPSRPGGPVRRRKKKGS